MELNMNSPGIYAGVNDDNHIGIGVCQIFMSVYPLRRNAELVIYGQTMI